MKAFKTLFAAVAVSALTASCLSSEDPYNAGFSFQHPKYQVTPVYANTEHDSLIFFSYGRWAVSNSATISSWFSMPVMSGSGNAWYGMLLTFAQNTTGESRYTYLTLEDTDHPDKARASLAYLQYATRGDGSLGSAADVKAIHGSDGSEIELTYDRLHRPLTLKMTKGGRQLNSLRLRFDDNNGLLQVDANGSNRMEAFYDIDYQPWQLKSQSDTVGVFYQYTSYGMAISPMNMFNIEHRTATKEYRAFLYKMRGQSLQPDSLHCADSLRYYRSNAAGEQMAYERLKLNFSTMDNRCQSVDVNQLLLGVEECDPYQLLSLFRYARNTSIISTATDGDDVITVTTELNADRSVSRLDVARRGETVTYTFDY